MTSCSEAPSFLPRTSAYALASDCSHLQTIVTAFAIFTITVLVLGIMWSAAPPGTTAAEVSELSPLVAEVEAQETKLVFDEDVKPHVDEGVEHRDEVVGVCPEPLSTLRFSKDP